MSPHSQLQVGLPNLKKGGVPNSAMPQTRTVYVFDSTTQELKGTMFTPPIKFNDINLFAQKMYGPNVIGLNLDGDFYAGMLDLRNMNRDSIKNSQLIQNTNMYFQQSGMCLVAPKINPQINTMPKGMLEDAKAKYNTDKNNNKIADIFKYLNSIFQR